LSEPTSSEPSEDAKEAAPEGKAARVVRLLSAAPPLALLAVLAAACELVLARVVWHGLPEVLAPEDLFEVRRLARFPRNLAAVAGTIALTIGLLGFLRFPGYAPIGRRLAVAAFSGIFVPSVVVSAVLRPELLRRKLVIFALAAANVMVTLVAMTAVRYRADRALRIGLALASATGLLTLLFVGVGQLAQAEGGIWDSVAALLTARTTTVETVLIVLRHSGELCWVGVLACVCFAVAHDRGGPGMRMRIVWTSVLVVAFTAGILLLRSATGHRFRFVLFGTLRLGLFLDDAPALYALPLAIGLAAACVGLARSEPTQRQIGAGMLAWVCAGFAPHTPIQLLYMVLATMLLARAAQARDPDGAWIDRQPWARFAGLPSSPPPAPRNPEPQSPAASAD
jgi:hypothetical protein